RKDRRDQTAPPHRPLLAPPRHHAMLAHERGDPAMIRFVLAGLACLVTAPAALAQAYPDRTIRIITGTQTGTSGDLAGRLLAQKLTAQMGQPVVFESRPGANGQIAANYAKGLAAE